MGIHQDPFIVGCIHQSFQALSSLPLAGTCSGLLGALGGLLFLSLSKFRGIVVLVEPVVVRNVRNPPVAAAGMIEYHVHHHLDIPGVGGFDHVAVLIVGAETRIDHVEIRDGVTVGGIAPVVLYRVQPYSGNSKIVNIFKMILDALQVAAMVCSSVPAVDLELLPLVIGRIAVRETVRHDQVKDILGCESLGPLPGVPGPEFEGLFCLFPTGLEGKSHCPGRSRIGDIKVDEQVVGILYLGDLLDGDAGIVCQGELARGDVLSVEHHLKFVILHSGVPEWGIHTLDLGCGRPCRCCQVRRDSHVEAEGQGDSDRRQYLAASHDCR